MANNSSLPKIIPKAKIHFEISGRVEKFPLGPIIGPNGDFSSLPDISKWILTIGMILGRLELFAILVLFLPSFWRN